MSDGTSSLSDDVRAAMTQAEDESETSTAPPAAAETTTTAPAAPEPAETASTAAERARDEKGRFKTKEDGEIDSVGDITQTAEPKKPTQTVAKPPVQAVETATPPPAQESTPDLRPPGRWPVAAREKWAQVPPEVRQVIHARERETAVALQRTAKEREYAEKVRETFAPFDASIRANGGDTLTTASAALQMVYRLTHGHDQEKAQLLAGLVQRFRVPVEALDQALVGTASGTQPPAPSIDPAQIEQRVMQRLMAQRQQAETQRAAAEVEAMESDPAFEFLDDVREDMADILELAHRRGKAMSVKDAYTKACQQHEDVSRIVSQRKEAEAAKAKMAPARQVVKQATSLKSDAPVVQNGARKSGSLRDDVEAALSELSS